MKCGIYIIMQFKLTFTHKLLISTTILGFSGYGGYYSYKYLNSYFRKSADHHISDSGNHNLVVNTNIVENNLIVKDNSAIISKQEKSHITERYHPTDFIHGLLSAHSYENRLQ